MQRPEHRDESSGLPEAAELPCAFAHALFAGHAACELARRRTFGEGERVACTRAVAGMNCATLHAMIFERCAFSLGRARRGEPPSHATAMRVQCGGLDGVRGALGATDGDVHRMVVAAQERFGGLAGLPWEAIARAVAAWRPRRRARDERT